MKVAEYPETSNGSDPGVQESSEKTDDARVSKTSMGMRTQKTVISAMQMLLLARCMDSGERVGMDRACATG